MKDVRYLRLRLETLRKCLVKDIHMIDRVLESINEIKKDAVCPNCFTGNIRRMIKGKIFCRNCGFDNREEQVKEEKDNGK